MYSGLRKQFIDCPAPFLWEKNKQMQSVVSFQLLPTPPHTHIYSLKCVFLCLIKAPAVWGEFDDDGGGGGGPTTIY